MAPPPPWWWKKGSITISTYMYLTVTRNLLPYWLTHTLSECNRLNSLHLAFNFFHTLNPLPLPPLSLIFPRLNFLPTYSRHWPYLTFINMFGNDAISVWKAHRYLLLTTIAIGTLLTLSYTRNHAQAVSAFSLSRFRNTSDSSADLSHDFSSLRNSTLGVSPCSFPSSSISMAHGPRLVRTSLHPQSSGTRRQAWRLPSHLIPLQLYLLGHPRSGRLHNSQQIPFQPERLAEYQGTSW